MGALLLALGNAIVNALKNPASAGNPNEALQVALFELQGIVGKLTDAILQVMYQEYGAVLYVQDIAKQIGHDFEQIEGSWESNFRYLLGTILPNSLGYVVGYVFSTGIVPLRARLTTDESNISFLLGWRGQIDAWRKYTVDPDLADLEAFKASLIKVWQPIIYLWITWLRYPGQFAQWATPPLAGSLVSYFAQPEHKTSRDDLSRIMLQAWQEQPEQVLTAIEQWLVTEP